MTDRQPPLSVLIDGTNSVYRDFHAAQDGKGILFRKRLQSIQDCWRPRRIIVAFDHDSPSFRSELFPAYKGERTKPDGIEEAIDAATHACIAESIDGLTVAGFEADDIVATFCRMAVNDGHRVVIVSADKDLHQLIRDGVVSQAVKLKRKGDRIEGDFVTSEGLRAKYGVTPEQWVDYRTMIGDTSDNIAGVRNVGPVAAKQVLQDCGSLDDFYRSPFKAQVTQRTQTALFNAKKDIGLLRQLLTLRVDVPLPEYWTEEVCS